MSALKSWVARRLTDQQKQRIKRWLIIPDQWRARRRQRAVQKIIGTNAEQPATVRIDGTFARLVERGYDALAEVSFNLEQVKSCLTKHGIEYVQLPHWRPYQPLLVVDQAQSASAIAALQSLPPTAGWDIDIDREVRKLSLGSWFADRQTPLRARAFRHLIAANGRSINTLAEAVTIEFWETLPAGISRMDGETHVPGTLHRRIQRRSHSGPFVEYLPPKLWRQAQKTNGMLHWAAPHLYQFTEPVDIVYTWVDGSDPAWRQRKNQAAGIINEKEYNSMAANTARYISRDELKYSLRSVEMYANWIRHIFIVTDQQIPNWLDVNHPKITVIDHRDIFIDRSTLPVFNSHAIESQLHHIPGLSEYYLYMNDDFLFMRPTTPDLFFTGNGLTRYFPSTAPLDISPSSARDLPVLAAAKRGREFMQMEHGRTVTNKFKHTPMPQKKSVLMTMEAEYPDLFRQVAASQFRHPDDYSIPSSLYHYRAYALGQATVSSIRYGYVDISQTDTHTNLTWLLHRHTLDVLCLNETDTPDCERKRVDKAIALFMEAKFPVPSTFETRD